jgi:hypothetical protein
MKDPAAEVNQVTSDYKAALDKVAQVGEGIASEFARLADELDRQGQLETADMLLQASHYHRASSIRSRAIAASLGVLTRASLVPLHHTPTFAAAGGTEARFSAP